MADIREKIERELQISFDVSENIGEEIISFVAIKMSRNQRNKVVPTVVVICDDKVARETQQIFSDKLWGLAKIMKEASNLCEHGNGLDNYCEPPCGRVNGGDS